MSARCDVKGGCASCCADMLDHNCIADVFADVFLRVLAAALKFSLTLSCGDCLSCRKALSAMRGCVSIWGEVDWVRATSLSLSGLDGSVTGDRGNTEGDLIASSLSGADDFIGLSLLVEAVVVPSPIGIKTLKGAGKKPKQSSWRSVSTMCLCVSAMRWGVSDSKLLGLFLVGTMDVGGGSRNNFSRS